MNIKYTVHFKKAPAFSLFMCPIAHVWFSHCSASEPGRRMLSAEHSPKIVGMYGGAFAISCAVLGFTEQVCFHSFKLISLARGISAAPSHSKASLISLIKSTPCSACLTRPERDANEEFPFEIKYTGFVSQCFCVPCFLSFHVISDITEPGSRGTWQCFSWGRLLCFVGIT